MCFTQANTPSIASLEEAARKSTPSPAKCSGGQQPQRISLFSAGRRANFQIGNPRGRLPHRCESAPRAEPLERDLRALQRHGTVAHVLMFVGREGDMSTLASHRPQTENAQHLFARMLT